MSSTSKPFPVWHYPPYPTYQYILDFMEDEARERNEKRESNLRQANRVWNTLKNILNLPEQAGFDLQTGKLIFLPKTEAGRQLKEELERFWCQE